MVWVLVGLIGDWTKNHWKTTALIKPFWLKRLVILDFETQKNRKSHSTLPFPFFHVKKKPLRHEPLNPSWLMRRPLQWLVAGLKKNIPIGWRLAYNNNPYMMLYNWVHKYILGPIENNQLGVPIDYYYSSPWGRSVPCLPRHQDALSEVFPEKDRKTSHHRYAHLNANHPKRD